MEQKNRTLFTIAVIVLIFGALIASFGRSLFSLDTPDVSLPNLSELEQGSSSSGSSSQNGAYQAVSVTPKTVQNVIATLNRSTSYYRQLQVETFWSDGSNTATVQVWKDDGWLHSCQTLPSGAIRHDLVGNEMLYYWYEGERAYRTTGVDAQSADLAQHVPTYETVLALEPDNITAAGYELYETVPCIFVEARPNGSQTVTRYWISIDSGLLLCAEAFQGETLIYRMHQLDTIQSPCPDNAVFRLPDGTVLHTT